MSAQREHDLVLLGATGFAGRLAAAHLAQHAPPGLRIALAGRSADRLSATRDSLGPAAADWPLVTADSAEAASMDALAHSARVVATAAGPYRPHGLLLAEACAVHGTHYADLAGEVLFMRESAERLHAVAQRSGARIVHACGFDSIPSDLGMLLLHEAARDAGAGDLEQATLVVRVARGGVSGGTMSSMRVHADEVRGDPALGRIVRDPYALSPDRSAEPDLGPQRDLLGLERDDDLGLWLAPFVMAPVNTRVVRRSNALLGVGLRAAPALPRGRRGARGHGARAAAGGGDRRRPRGAAARPRLRAGARAARPPAALAGRGTGRRDPPPRPVPHRDPRADVIGRAARWPASARRATRATRRPR